MAHLMLVNKGRKRRASPKQLAALRKARAARKTGKKRRVRRINTPTVTAVKRRRRSTRPAGVAFRTRKYRRNPDKFSLKGFVKNSLTPSALGAGGALGLDLALGMLPLPDILKTDTARQLVRVAGAIGIGMLGSMIAGRKMGESIGSGALTVVLYDELKKLVKKTMPTLQLGEDDYSSIEYVNPALIADDMGQYVNGIATNADDLMGKYVV